NGTYYIIGDRMKRPFNYIKSLNRIMKENNYDIVHAHGNSHTLALEMGLARKNNVKVRIPHAHSTSTKFPLIHKLLTPYFNTTYTHGLSCGITAGKWLYSNNEFIVLDNGINVDKFKFNKNIRYAKREELGIKEEDIIIGSVGFLDTNKNQEYLIDLVDELHQSSNQKYKLMLIGD